MTLERFLEELAAEQAADTRLEHHAQTGLALIGVPAGMARLGRPAASVSVPGFALSRHPVTNAQFAAFLSSSGYQPDDAQGFLSHWPAPDSPPPERRDHPVVFVSWFDAMAYCDWAGLTLPSEAMWEKAARGTDGRRFPWGAQVPRPYNRLAQVMATETAPIGSFSEVRTATGCEDMIGNVSEWCWPTDDHTARPSLSDPPPQHPVRGSAYMRHRGYSGRMDAAHQRFLSAARRNHWVGFRPARVL